MFSNSAVPDRCTHFSTMASQKRPSSLYMDLKELRNRFDEVDIDGKGYIDYRGLQEMISGMEGFNSSALQELMDTLDRDRDGKVCAHYRSCMRTKATQIKQLSTVLFRFVTILLLLEIQRCKSVAATPTETPNLLAFFK